MAEFMVERHADGAEAGPAQPGTVLGAFAGGAGGRVDDDFGEGFGEGFGAFEGEEGDYWVAFLGVEGFDCSGEVGRGLAGMHGLLRSAMENWEPRGKTYQHVRSR